MYQRLNDLMQYGVRSADGMIGTIHDFYFDDETWSVRYAVINLDPSLGARDILVSTAVFETILPLEGVITTSLTPEKARNSPEIDTEQPITRQQESDLSSYYLVPEYWIPNTGYGLGVGDLSAVPMVDLEADLQEQQERQENDHEPDSHLYSTMSLLGFHILTGQNEDIGVVEDFLLDEEDWDIDFLVADVGSWLENRKIILSPDWVERFSRVQSLLFVDLDRQSIEASPEFTGDLDATYIHELYVHYQKEETRPFPDDKEA